MKEDRGPILGPYIRPLPVHRSGVVRSPKNVQQVIVGDLRGVEVHFHRLRMASPPGADLFLWGVGGGPPPVPPPRRLPPRDLPKSRLHSPKASRRECRLLR